MELFEGAKNYVTEKLSDIPVPEARISDVDLKVFRIDGITLVTTVSVSNPYGVPIPMGEISYKMESAEREILFGSISDLGSLKSNDVTLVQLTLRVPHTAVISLLRDIVADWDIDYALELALIIDLPLIGIITIPMRYKGEMKLPTFFDFFSGKSAHPKETTVQIKH